MMAQLLVFVNRKNEAISHAYVNVLFDLGFYFREVLSSLKTRSTPEYVIIKQREIKWTKSHVHHRIKLFIAYIIIFL